MKLKREVQGKITVLVASESFNAQDLAVLRAGVGKMAAAGTDKLVLLDVSQLKPESPSLDQELNSLPLLAAENEMTLLLAGPTHADQGGANLQDAKTKMLSSDFKKSLEELFLSGRIARLERRKSQLEAEATQAGKLEAEFIAVRKRNSELKLLNRSLLRQVRGLLSDAELLASPTGPAARPVKDEHKRILDMVQPILDQLGVAKL